MEKIRSISYFGLNSKHKTQILKGLYSPASRAINIPRILLSNFPELSRPAKPLLQSQYHQFTFHSWCKIVLLEVSHGLGKKLNISFSWLNYN